MRRDGLTRQREKRGLSQEKLAVKLGVATSTVWRWERGLSTPYPYQRPRLAKILDVSLEELAELLDPPLTPPLDGRTVTGEEELDLIRTELRQLIGLDGQHGGNDLVAMAVRLFQGARARLATRRYEPELERELAATVGELGQLAAWVAYDASRLKLSRQLNQEAMLVSRLAGDRSMELFELDHLAMQAIYEHRPDEALRVAEQMISDGRVSGRTSGLFRIRRARALAQTGERRGALDDIDHVRTLLTEGIGADDPAWTWWVDDAELAWHEASIHADLGDWAAACDIYEAAWELRGGRETPSWRPWSTRAAYNDLAHLLDAQVHVATWPAAERSLVALFPMVAEIGSARTSRVLQGVVDRIEQSTTATSTLVDGAHALRDELASDSPR